VVIAQTESEIRAKSWVKTFANLGWDRAPVLSIRKLQMGGGSNLGVAPGTREGGVERKGVFYVQKRGTVTGGGRERRKKPRKKLFLEGNHKGPPHSMRVWVGKGEIGKTRSSAWA